MNEPTVVVVASEKGKSYSFMGTRIVVKASGEDTGGAYALMDLHIPRGGGSPSHIHRICEKGYWILSGELTFVVGEKHERIVAKPGDYIRIPKGLLVHYINQGEHHVQALCMSIPAGIEHFYAEVGTQLASSTTNPSLAKVDEIHEMMAKAPKYGMEIFVKETQPAAV